LWLGHLPSSQKEKGETGMAKIDLDSLGIEELAALRDNAADKLTEKVAARRAELEAELEKLLQYGRPAKKSQEVVPAAKARKSDEKKGDEVKEAAGKEPIAKESVAKEVAKAA
jgi:hypothetical protein